MLNANLNEVKEFLETKGYNAFLLNQSKELPIDQLVVELDRDSKERERWLLIRAAKQDLSSNDEMLGIKSKIRHYQELQLIVTLPFYVLDSQIPDLARLILLLNRGMELPGFELSEVDHLIFFRYAFVVPENDLDIRIFLSLIGMIELLLEAFSDVIESVAIGEQTLEQVVENAKKMIEMRKKPATTP